MTVAVKRVYDKSARRDGTRVLVDRLWPRGVTKDRAAIHAWLRELAPSQDLCHWFRARPEGWSAFRKRYMKELAQPQAQAPLQKLYELSSRSKPLTLLHTSKDEEHNNAVVLKDLLEGMRKPPTGTGAGAIRASRERQAKRMPR